MQHPPVDVTRSCVCQHDCGLRGLDPKHMYPHAGPDTAVALQSFVAGLEDLPESVRAELQQLTPMTYTGNAADQAKQLTKHLGSI